MGVRKVALQAACLALHLISMSPSCLTLASHAHSGRASPVEAAMRDLRRKPPPDPSPLDRRRPRSAKADPAAAGKPIQWSKGTVWILLLLVVPVLFRTGSQAHCCQLSLGV